MDVHAVPTNAPAVLVPSCHEYPTAGPSQSAESASGIHGSNSAGPSRTVQNDFPPADINNILNTPTFVSDPSTSGIPTKLKGKEKETEELDDEIKDVPVFVRFQRLDPAPYPNTDHFALGIVYFESPSDLNPNNAYNELHDSILQCVLDNQFDLQKKLERFVGIKYSKVRRNNRLNWWWKKPKLSVRWDKKMTAGECHMDVELNNDYDVRTALFMMESEMAERWKCDSFFIATWESIGVPQIAANGLDEDAIDIDLKGKPCGESGGGGQEPNPAVSAGGEAHAPDTGTSTIGTRSWNRNLRPADPKSTYPERIKRLQREGGNSMRNTRGTFSFRPEITRFGNKFAVGRTSNVSSGRQDAQVTEATVGGDEVDEDENSRSTKRKRI